MSRKPRREHLTPDLTPLIDVVFLLLIFFMVSSVFKKEELALLLNLPKSEKGNATKSKTLDITIELSAEKIAFQGKNIELDELEQKLGTAKKESLVNLRVDGKVKYERLVSVLDTLQKLKLENLSLVTVKK